MLFYNLIPKGGLMPPFDNPLFLKGALSVACGDSSPIGGAKSCLPRLAWRRVGKHRTLPTSRRDQGAPHIPRRRIYRPPML